MSLKDKDVVISTCVLCFRKNVHQNKRPASWWLQMVLETYIRLLRKGYFKYAHDQGTQIAWKYKTKHGMKLNHIWWDKRKQKRNITWYCLLLQFLLLVNQDSEQQLHPRDHQNMHATYQNPKSILTIKSFL